MRMTSGGSDRRREARPSRRGHGADIVARVAEKLAKPRQLTFVVGHKNAHGRGIGY